MQEEKMTNTQKMERAVEIGAIANKSPQDYEDLMVIVMGLIGSGFFKEDLALLEAEAICITRETSDFFVSVGYLERFLVMREPVSGGTIRIILRNHVKQKILADLADKYLAMSQDIFSEVGSDEIVRIGAIRKLLFGCPSDWLFNSSEVVEPEIKSAIGQIFNSNVCQDAIRRSLS